jgi:hypothetical protein
LVVLRLQLRELAEKDGPPGDRLACEVLPVLAQRLLGLILELVGRRLDLLRLQLDPLA